MSMQFHPLAELFPLIEGAEFDELVSSIKENGQLEPITTLDGAILDGRNRYRACKAAGIEPRMERFTGRDPVRFVFIKNINRRHLTISQRALIAAEFAKLEHGWNRFSNVEVEISTSSLRAEEAAEIMGVDRATVFSAKTVLRDGTSEEVESVRSGKAAVSTVAKTIRKRMTPEKKSELQKTHSHSQQMRADIWRRFRDALENLNSLPLPAEVVLIARSIDKKAKGAAVQKRLPAAIEWLREFDDVWSNGNV